MLIIVEREYKKMSNTEMKELSLDESREINGVTWSRVLTGAGVAAIGVACIVAAPSVAVAAAGYAAYNAAQLV